MPCLDEQRPDPSCAWTPTRDQIAAVIQEHGQIILAALSDDEHPGFVYTIGRTERGLPELVVFAEGFQELMEHCGMLNYLGPRDVKDGHLVGKPDGPVFAVTDLKEAPEMIAALHESYVVQADLYYGRPVEVLFLVPLEDRELHLTPVMDDLEFEPSPGLH